MRYHSKSIPKGKLDELVQAGLEAEARAPQQSFAPSTFYCSSMPIKTMY